MKVTIFNDTKEEMIVSSKNGELIISPSSIKEIAGTTAGNMIVDYDDQNSLMIILKEAEELSVQNKLNQEISILTGLDLETETISHNIQMVRKNIEEGETRSFKAVGDTTNVTLKIWKYSQGTVQIILMAN